MASAKEVIKTIHHYKKSLEAAVDEKRILHCLGVLFKVPVTVTLLQETGIGRTVNGLCKSDAGEVRTAAKGLVNKWKALVVNESSAEEEAERQSQDDEQEVRDTSKKHRSGSSLHRKEEAEVRKKDREQRSHHHQHHHHKSSSSRSDDHHRSSRVDKTGSGDAVNGSGKPQHHSQKQPEEVFEEEEHNDEKPQSKKDTSNGEHGHRHSKEDKSKKRSRDSEGKDRSTKRHRKEASANVREEEVEIDNSAGTSFADALAMMDGPPSTPNAKKPTMNSNPPGDSPVKTKATRSVQPTPSSSSSSGSSLTCSITKAHSQSQVSGKKSTIVTPSTSKSNRPATSGPPKLLAPSTKLAPLLDPEELKRDILGPSVVISNSYTPASYLNAAIMKNKRPVGQNAPPPVEKLEILQSRARTKVYSGNKCAQVVGSLQEMCIRVLQKNVDALEYTGGVPFLILEPILLKCSASQLDQIEYYNPYLTEDTNDLWKKHTERAYRGKKPQEWESWRELYQRCQQEEQDRLSSLTESIKQSQQTSLPVKQTKMAYMDRQAPPMGRRRGTGGGFGSAAGPSINASLTSRTTVSGTRMGFLTAGREVQGKRAPLMAKTLALMKKSIKR